MNTSLITHPQALPPRPARLQGNHWPRLSLALFLAGLVVGASGCKTSRAVSHKHVETSGFLGNYSQLHPGVGDQAALVYFNPDADWKKYTKIKIEPVQLWNSGDPDSPMGKLSPGDQQMLMGTFYDALITNLSKDFQLVDQPGPNVIVVRSALTQAKKSKPVSNLITSVYFPLRAVSFGKRLVTGTDIAVGSVTVEVELLDGQTNQRLAAAVDRRAGTKAWRTKFNNTWSDVELAFDYWAKRLDMRLVEERIGSASKTDIGGSENP